MITYYSDVTKQYYPTREAAELAERDADRKARAEAAMIAAGEAAKKAQVEYERLKEAFEKEYGTAAESATIKANGDVIKLNTNDWQAAAEKWLNNVFNIKMEPTTLFNEPATKITMPKKDSSKTSSNLEALAKALDLL